MKKVKMREIILGVAVIAILCCVSTVNYASQSDLNDLFKGNEIENIEHLPSNPVNDTGVNDVGVNNITKIPDTNTTPIAPTNTTKNTNTNNTALPKTGVDDTMIWVLIGISAVAAIYTYKKVRDYNV